MRIETALAKASLTQVERRDPYKIYHRKTLASLHEDGARASTGPRTSRPSD